MDLPLSNTVPEQPLGSLRYRKLQGITCQAGDLDTLLALQSYLERHTRDTHERLVSVTSRTSMMIEPRLDGDIFTIPYYDGNDAEFVRAKMDELRRLYTPA